VFVSGVRPEHRDNQESLYRLGLTYSYIATYVHVKPHKRGSCLRDLMNARNNNGCRGVTSGGVHSKSSSSAAAKPQSYIPCTQRLKCVEPMDLGL
jgi:hypothetical protein